MRIINVDGLELQEYIFLQTNFEVNSVPNKNRTCLMKHSNLPPLQLESNLTYHGGKKKKKEQNRTNNLVYIGEIHHLLFNLFL